MLYDEKFKRVLGFLVDLELARGCWTIIKASMTLIFLQDGRQPTKNQFIKTTLSIVSRAVDNDLT